MRCRSSSAGWGDDPCRELHPAIAPVTVQPRVSTPVTSPSRSAPGSEPSLPTWTPIVSVTALEEGLLRAHEELRVAGSRFEDAKDAARLADLNEPSRLANTYIGAAPGNGANADPVAAAAANVAATSGEVERLIKVEDSLEREITRVQASLRNLTSAHHAIAAELVSNPRGLLLVRDELAGWIGGMNLYSRGDGNDRAFWLQAHGGRPWTPDRVKDGEKARTPKLSHIFCGACPEAYDPTAWRANHSPAMMTA